MRSDPVSRDEIRISRRGQITTLPADTVRAGKCRPKPIEKLWIPLVEALKAEHHEREAGRHSLWGSRATSSKPPRIPRPHCDWGQAPVRCTHCGRCFYHATTTKRDFCSDCCAKAHYTAAAVKARSKARAEKRAGGKCEVCGKPLKAQRSTKRLCSGRCRLAKMRAAP
jgi:hypothetical protein